MKFFIGLVWAVATGCLFYFGHDHYLCRIRGLCNEEISNTKRISENVPVKEEGSIPNFMIKDEGSDVFTFNGSPIVNKGELSLVTPDTLGAIPDSIYSYLNKNLDKEVHVVMHYDPNLNHANNVSDSSLASKRLKGFVANLMHDGINADKIKSKLVARPGLYASDLSYDGLDVGFKTISEETKAEIDKGITNKILYAAFGKGEFKADRTLSNYATELKDYLKRNPSKSVTVTGHTDDVGKVASNYRLGLVRAQNVRGYLVSRGVAKDKVKAYSKGETAPIDPSKTPEARSLNRRIEVIVK